MGRTFGFGPKGLESINTAPVTKSGRDVAVVSADNVEMREGPEVVTASTDKTLDVGLEGGPGLQT